MTPTNVKSPYSCHSLHTLITFKTVALSLLLLCIGSNVPVIQARALPYFDEPVVTTKLGVLRGKRIEFNNTPINAFLGVPYAKPPIGERRFRPPEMVDPWQGELIAQNLSKTCHYTIDKAFPLFPGAEMWNPPNALDEDCLSLNMWVPENHDGSVMVWIYGGGFFSGSPSLDLYDGRVMATMEKTIVININYRLGVFGFLYLPDTPITGNMGLLDQQVALKWIHENIAHFGGDPNRVTLFGESAGGASAAAHLFAPGSSNYFNKIIINSGVILHSWATKPRYVMEDLSARLAVKLNCTVPGSGNDMHYRIPKEDLRGVIDCMITKSPQIIQEESDKVSAELVTNAMAFAFVPVREDPLFFQGDVMKKMQAKDFKKDVSVIIGAVKDEGTYWLPYYLADTGFHFNHTVSANDDINRALISRSDYEKSIGKFMPYFGNSVLVQNALLNAYQQVSTSTNDRERNRDGVGRFVGDFFFTCSLIEFADILADHVFGSVYMYYFTQRSSANPWPRWMGTMHGYEIEYIFGMPFRAEKSYDKAQLATEKAISHKIMNYWKNFAATGVPVKTWPRYNRITQQTFVLDAKIALTDEADIVTGDKSLGKQCALLKEATNYRKPECISDLPQLPDVDVAVSSALNSASIPQLLSTLITTVFMIYLHKI